MSSTLERIEVAPQGPPRSAVIWLHGLGASGHDFEPVIPELGLPQDHGIHFVFPHAPAIPVTINGGMVMPAWYDILELSIDRKVDTGQIRESADQIIALVDEQVQRGIATENIVIAGFSQGGAVAYEAALSFERPLAGLLILSSYFATADSIELNAANRQLPIALFHGDHDPMVPVALGEQAWQRCKGMGYQAEFHRYPMEHAVCLEEIRLIGTYLKRWLSL